jgi:hypothetical protein
MRGCYHFCIGLILLTLLRDYKGEEDHLHCSDSECKLTRPHLTLCLAFFLLYNNYLLFINVNYLLDSANDKQIWNKSWTVFGTKAEWHVSISEAIMKTFGYSIYSNGLS